MSATTNFSKVYWKNWKFWYKLFAGLATIGILLAVYISGVMDVQKIGQEILEWFDQLDKNNLTLQRFIYQFDYQFAGYFRLDWISVVPVINSDIGYDQVVDLSISAGFGEYSIFFATFFTNISNFLIGVWLLAAAFMPTKEGKNHFLGYSNTMILATYIAITMIIFTAILMPFAFIGGIVLTWEFIAVMVFQHLVFPLLFLGYICYFYSARTTLVRNKKYMSREWWKIVFWLLIYLAFTLIRGEIRYRGKRPIDTQYPYFFLQIHQTKIMGMPGYVWLILTVFLVIGLCFGVSILLNTLVGMRIKKQKKKKFSKIFLTKKEEQWK